MAGWSQTLVIGRVGRDSQMRYLANGTACCVFSVAVTKKFGKGDERKEKTTWYRVTCWRQLAETANEYVRKGMQIMVVGEVETRPYLDNAGQPAASLELTADTLQFLGQRGEGAPVNEGSSTDDIPF